MCLMRPLRVFDVGALACLCACVVSYSHRPGRYHVTCTIGVTRVADFWTDTEVLPQRVPSEWYVEQTGRLLEAFIGYPDAYLRAARNACK